MNVYLDFQDLLRGLDNQSYGAYRRLKNACIALDDDILCFRHIQGSPGALPASVCEVKLPASTFSVPGWALSNEASAMAAADFVWRSFTCAVKASAS
ncbi:MAG: hypothetical protein KFF68_19445 [Desulfosarcina sp.]|nr:hypothetical protein [Desulfosarcina sp.]